MIVPSVSEVKTQDEARQLAIDWQNWQSEQSLSYEDLILWQSYFEKLGEVWGLADEFKEEGIV